MANNKLINELITSIQSQYTVNDLEIPQKNRATYKTVTNIVEDKITQIINNDLPSNIINLLSNVKRSFNDFEVMNELQLQFPSYSFSIELKMRKIEYLTIISFIRVKLSLIFPCFTVFYEEVSFYENFSKFRPIIFRILSSKNGNIDIENDYFNTIIALVKRHFFGYEYVNHQMLFLNKLPNIFPYNYHQDNYTGNHYLYEFLFDDVYNSGNIEVTF